MSGCTVQYVVKVSLVYLKQQMYFIVCVLHVHVLYLQLKEVFPRFRLALPPKRWFKDNYDMDFLEERQIGLQTFLQNLIAHKDIINRYTMGTVSLNSIYISRSFI